MDSSMGAPAAMGMNMPMLPANISEPPPAYSSTPLPHHTRRSRSGYHNLPKDDVLFDPITGERLLQPYGYLDRSARANRQRIWCFFILGMIMIMIALVIAGVVYHFGKQNSSDTSNDCYESVLNGYTCD